MVSSVPGVTLMAGSPAWLRSQSIVLTWHAGNAETAGHACSAMKQTPEGTDRQMDVKTTISNCEVCADTANRWSEAGPTELNKLATVFLTHAVNDHQNEVLELLVRECLPVFIARRNLRQGVDLPGRRQVSRRLESKSRGRVFIPENRLPALNTAWRS